MVENSAPTVLRCPACGGELIQKSRPRLLLVGLTMLAAPALARVWTVLWVPAIVLALTGIYLVVWATLGRARWCRNCKKFPLG